MASQLVIAVSLTIGVSALCSILEAMVLSVTTAEIEQFKKKAPKRGRLLDQARFEIEETSAAILSLNTIANTLGATLAGGLAEKTFGDGSNSILFFAGGMTLGILFFSQLRLNSTQTFFSSLLIDLNILCFRDSFYLI